MPNNSQLIDVACIAGGYGPGYGGPRPLEDERVRRPPPPPRPIHASSGGGRYDSDIESLPESAFSSHSAPHRRHG